MLYFRVLLSYSDVNPKYFLTEQPTGLTVTCTYVSGPSFTAAEAALVQLVRPTQRPRGQRIVFSEGGLAAEGRLGDAAATPAAALRHQAATLPRRRLPPDNDREDGDGGGESTAAGGYQLIHLLIRYTN